MTRRSHSEQSEAHFSAASMTASRPMVLTWRSQSTRLDRRQNENWRWLPISTNALTTNRPCPRGDLRRCRRWADGGVRAADRQESWSEKGPDHIPDRRQKAFCGNLERLRRVQSTLKKAFSVELVKRSATCAGIGVDLTFKRSSGLGATQTLT